MVPLADFGGWGMTKMLYHQALVDMVPEWREFAIESSSVYLGARLGPSTDPAARWAAALDKVSKRTLGMARSTLAPSAGLKYMATFATPVVAYTAMLAAPHKNIERTEDLALQRLLRMPHKALPKHFTAHLEAVGLPRARPMAHSCSAMLRRSALRHADYVRALSAQLAAVRAEHGSLLSLADDDALPDRTVWNAPALIDDMKMALEDETHKAADATDPPPSKAEMLDAAATALLPRVRRWFDGRRDAGALHLAIVEALAAAKRTSACFVMALLRTWCDGWGTSHRAGRGPAHCAFCGRRAADNLRHLMRCPALLRPVAVASGTATPTSFHDALCLKATPAAEGTFRRSQRRPSSALFRLTVASEVYHKVIGRSQEHNWHTSHPSRVAAAAKSAARKFRGL